MSAFLSLFDSVVHATSVETIKNYRSFIFQIDFDYQSMICSFSSPFEQCYHPAANP